MGRILGLLVMFLTIAYTVRAQIPAIPDSAKNVNTDFHFQLTTVTQHKPAMHAPYSGTNSLTGNSESATTLTATIFWGMSLWKGGEVYFNPEISGGAGLSSALGIAGFTNGEAFRVGDPAPKIYTARFYFNQTFNLGGTHTYIGESANQVSKTRTQRYISITLGKFGVADFFDNNAYSHDPRSQFLNWSLMSMGGWDYPANTRGYTWGSVVEFGYPMVKLRGAAVLVPKEANGNELDTHISNALGYCVELEKSYSLKSRPGTLRLLGALNNARMGNYRQALVQNPTAPDIIATRQYGRTKWAMGLNMEQQIGNHTGMFARASWNDGKNETWAFTEIDKSVHAGLLVNGAKWKRNNDEWGLAAVINGLSQPHKNYLAAGGYGFIIGDGKLTYAPEHIAEMYYKINLFYTGFWLTTDYQFVVNPAYNKDRGPAHVVTLRAHIEL
ncbi:MAG: carbohydrate porin [Cyclobacteriaceae bacterium]|nr:carbohydrate porin [Cyclobacteriaceae bacterium]